MPKNHIIIEYKTTVNVLYDLHPVERMRTYVSQIDIELPLLMSRGLNADTVIRDRLAEHCRAEHVDGLSRRPFKIPEVFIKKFFAIVDGEEYEEYKQEAVVMCDDCGDVTDPNDIARCGGCNKEICSARNEGLHEGRCKENSD